MWTTSGAVAAGYLGNHLAKGTIATGLVPHFLGMFTLGMFAAACAHGRGLFWEGLRRRVPWTGLACGAAVCFVFVILAFPTLYDGSRRRPRCWSRLHNGRRAGPAL